MKHVILAAWLVATAGSAWARDVTLVKDGASRCVIVVTAGTLAEDQTLARDATPEVKETEAARRLLRESAADLAGCFEKMSGATVDIVEGLPDKDKRLPVFVGQAAEPLFGPVGLSFSGKQAFRVVVTRKGVGLYGESELATSYAVYEVLDRLGCRWYMPSDMGECIPERATIELAETDEALAPATEARKIWYADEAFKRRNRQGGVYLWAAHALEGHITKEQREQHPEWCAVYKGKPHPSRIKWTREDVAEAMASNIVDKLDKKYTPSVSLSPGDGISWDEEEDPKHDPGDWDPAAGVVSKTDRLLMLCNRVAERVGKKYPEVIFGLLAYVDYTRPPVREPVHPNVVPMIAPITFNRAHPMTTADHPNERWLQDLVEGWAKVTPRLSHYWYAYNLAETYAPNPFITKWATDVPICMANNCKFWMPETLPNFETTMPALYIGMRLSFEPDQDPAAIVDEMMHRFYGAAAEPMGAYWHHIDRAWIDAGEFAGCAFGYLRIFTPEVMAEARRLMDQALALCRTPMEYRRVRLADDSLNLFELFMKMRQDWAQGQWYQLTAEGEKWQGSARYLMGRYKDQYCFGSPTVFNYFEWFFKAGYEDATRIMRECIVLTRPPMREWAYGVDEEGEAEAKGWLAPEFDDSGWPKTDVTTDTWSTLGRHNYMGKMVYRRTQRLGGIPEGKKIYFWLGGTDGTTKLYVNGRHVPYVNDKGEITDEFSGYCKPASFDITTAARPGKPNQITVVCERKWLNELGTGGLMGPVALYREK